MKIMLKYNYVWNRQTDEVSIMDRESIYDVLIIGAGPAGVSAAIWCKRLGMKGLVLEQNAQIGGQLHQIHNEIIDYAGIVAMNGEHLNRLFEQHLDQLDISIRTNCRVFKIIPKSVNTMIVETDQSSLWTRSVILATGSSERALNIPGEQEMRARGEMYSSKKDLDLLKGKRVLIVGGGDRALEGACNIAEVAKSVLLVHRSAQFRARPEFLSKISKFTNARIETNTIIEAIHGTDRVQAVTLYNLIDGNNVYEEIDAILIRIGREPAQQYIPAELERTEDGFIIIDADGRTNIKSILAIGDLVNRPHNSSIAISVGQGMKAAKAILDDIKKEGGIYSTYGDLS